MAKYINEGECNMKDHYENACKECINDNTAKCVSCKRNSLYVDNYKKEKKMYWASTQMSKELLGNMIGIKDDIEIRNIEFDVTRNTVRMHVASETPITGMMRYVEGNVPPQVDLNHLVAEGIQIGAPATREMLMDQIKKYSREDM